MNAPIVIFTYNRVSHIENLIESLRKDPLSLESDLIVFSDGPKDSEDNIKVTKVRKYIHKIISNEYFKSVELVCSERNKGLANSVISGVDLILNKFEKVIVIEDDNIVSNSFLTFMNKGLEYYKDDTKIFTIGGYTAPFETPCDYKNDIFFVQRISSYAWATWKDRWDKIDWQVKSYEKFKHNFLKRKQFNAYGNDRSIMLDKQMLGMINSWAIRYEFSMFEEKMYCVLPSVSLIKPCGNDGSGTHSSKTINTFDIDLVDNVDDFVLSKFEYSSSVQKKFSKLFRHPISRRMAFFTIFNILKIDWRKS